VAWEAPLDRVFTHPTDVDERNRRFRQDVVTGVLEAFAVAPSRRRVVCPTTP